MLREYNVALVLSDTSFMPRPWELKQKFDLVTADFAYVRWLGDRKRIEKQTMMWDKTVIDRTSDLKNWVEVFKSLVSNTKSLENFRIQQQPLCEAWASDSETLLGLVGQKQ